MDGWMGGRTDGWVDVCIDGWINEWMDEQMKGLFVSGRMDREGRVSSIEISILRSSL